MYESHSELSLFFFKANDLENITQFRNLERLNI